MAKDFEHDDPMFLSGIMLPGDTQEAMAETFIEELLLMGYTDEAILRVFSTPYYAAAHRVSVERGDAYVLDLVARVRAGYGAVIRFGSKDAEVDHA